MYSAKNGSYDYVTKVGKKILNDTYKKFEKVVVPVDVQDGLINFVSWLIEDQKLNEQNSVISDRTFLVKSIKIIKANAILDGRDQADLSDLKALKFLLAFRIPEELLQLAEQKLESIEKQKKKTKK